MKKLIFTLFIMGFIILQSCKKDDDGIAPVDIDFNNASISIAEDAGAQTVTINFSQASPIAGTLTVTTGGTATYGDDYTTSIDGSSGTFDIEIAQGATSATFTITPVNDTNDEGNETATFTLSSSEGLLNIGSSATATVTLTDTLILVAIDGANGQMFSINPSTGETKDKVMITFDGSAFLRARSLCYDNNSGIGFLGERVIEEDVTSGRLFSLDFSTGQLTVANDNTTIDIDGMGGIADNGTTVIASPYHNQESSHVLLTYSKATGNIESSITVGNDGSASALVFGGQTNAIYRSSGNANIELVELSTGNSSSSISLTVSDSTPFTDVFSGFNISSAKVLNMTEDSNGNVYGSLQQSGYMFLVSINLNTGELTYISTLQNNGDANDRVFGLSFVQASAFN